VVDWAEIIGGIIIIGVMIGFGLISFSSGYSYGYDAAFRSLPSQIQCTNETTTIVKSIYKDNCNCESIPEWLYLIRTFYENKTYSEYGYNCLFYSGELSQRLRNLGYNSTVVTGHCDGQDYNHAWVRLCIDYEPQLGMEQSPSCVEGEYV
jgi:hypothetical protein